MAYIAMTDVVMTSDPLPLVADIGSAVFTLTLTSVATQFGGHNYISHAYAMTVQAMTV